MVRLELTTPRLYTALAIELTSSIKRKELSLSSWCIASLDIYHFSTFLNLLFLNCLIELVGSMAGALGL